MLKRLSLLALLVVVAAIGSTAPAAFARENMAAVHGTIYDLWTFTPLENVVIKVYSDSTLQLQTVVPDGTYSLFLPPGNYTITAKHYRDALLIYDTEENITLQENDNLTLDLIMFPTFEENELPGDYENIIPEFEEAEARGIWLGLAVVLAIGTAGLIALYYRKILPKRKLAGVEKVKEPSPVRIVGLPEDLKNVLDVIRESGGRINQVELRKKLPYSEAKVSLMIADLEDRGLVRKIKKGRGNIIVLKE
ncbi:MAG: hypothetical protein ACE5OT_00695 [Candidatus Hadarchaeaceae archaeon]